MERAINWTGDAVALGDPSVCITDAQSLCDVLRAGTIDDPRDVAVAGAFGIYLGLRGQEIDELAEFDRRLDELCATIGACHAAPALRAALDRLRHVSRETRKQGSRSEEQMVIKIRQRLLAEALLMLQE